MCAHYDQQTDPARPKTFFGVSDLPLGLKPSVWPGYHGPFLRKHEFADVGDEAVSSRELLVGSFGLIPHWAKDSTIARNTYNARSETVHEKPSYRDAWRLARHCIIPAEAIYEPDWRSGALYRRELPAPTENRWTLPGCGRPGAIRQGK